MSEELKAAIQARGQLKKRQTYFERHLSSVENLLLQTSIDKLDKSEIIELEGRLERHERLLSEFDSVQNKIELIVDSEDQMLERQDFENRYFKVTSTCKKIISNFFESVIPSVINTDPSGSSVPTKEVKLPDIELPKFSGDYKNFLEFRDLFDSLINSNKGLSKIQKFHYLRASLQGSPAQVIRSIEFSGDNYDIAWKTLCSRYDNKPILVFNHVKSLFNLPSLINESASDLKKMLDEISKHLRSLKTLNQPVEFWDTLLIHIFTNKLDKKTLREWEEKKLNIQGDTNDLPNLKNFKCFIKQKADLLETLELSREPKQEKGNQGSKTFSTVNSECVLCKKPHLIRNCPDFLKLSVSERIEKVKELKLCFNCLQGNHSVKKCNSSACRKCNRRHNTLLHYNNVSERTQALKATECVSPTTSTAISQSQQNISCVSSTNLDMSLSNSMCSRPFVSDVLLQTAVVQVLNSSGIPELCRVLLDGASQSNFITNECCDRLGLTKFDFPSTIMGVGQTVSELKYRTNVQVQSCINSFELNLSCIVIPSISGKYPSNEINVSSWNIPKHLKLADPEFCKPGKIDILIGAGVYLNLLCIGQISLGQHLPTLQKTRFGWIFGGEFSHNATNASLSRCHFNSNLDVQRQLEKFWEIEEVSSKDVVYSNEELQAEEIFSKTVSRDTNGRFITMMPFKQDCSLLGDSKRLALRRFYSMEKRFDRNPTLKAKYIQFMQEYESLGHMTKVSDIDDSKVSSYFPHHGVLNDNSQTTKLRVVFDGSALTDTGISLNQLQFIGPPIQNDLVSILFRFRQHKFIICADIVKMYRQILIHPCQRPLQRIFWRSDPSEQIQVYELNTVTYGTASAPFLAIRCLKQLAIENSYIFPRASQTIAKDFYMDDLLSGADTLEEAITLCDQVISILSSACFELQKWASNSDEILEHVQSSRKSVIMKLGEKSKTLGVYWSGTDDILMFNIIEKETTRKVSISKRSILSDIAQIFDPLGLIAPCVVIAKIILQKLWSYKLSWDESIPSDLDTTWRNFKSELSCINNLRIPRRVVCDDSVLIEIHGFADASSSAYGGCVYIRSIDKNGRIQVTLLGAKSRVAPVKSVTIPRLELCAALLLSQLIDKVRNSLNLNIQKYFLWSDSSVCLCWIKTSPNLLQTFIGNRVSQIQSLTDPLDWNHVRTEDNPADYLSRGVSPKNISSCKNWWNGPVWLSKSEEFWPKSSIKFPSDIPGMRKQINTFKVEYCDFVPFDRFSSLTKLKRVFGYCLRFIENSRNKQKIRLGPLSACELEFSLKTLVKISQRESFSCEIDSLTNKNLLNKKSKLLSLNPFIDSEGLLRVGGRLQLSKFAYEKKHPALISSKHKLTKLIFAYEHLRLLHAGPQQLLFSVREKYWPLRGRNLSRQTVHSCIRCFKTNPVQKNPLMGVLPESRVTPAPPFQTIGVDYAGPFQIKDRKGRGGKMSKCYISLFVCFSTKCVHLELVTDLTSEAFLAAFRRFTSRRGKPVNVYSDNGTNFVGAKNELEELGLFLKNNENVLSESIANYGVNWHFIAAMSPHMGGLWEAGVKSCKFHLKRVLGNASVTYEEFYTLLTEIEAILNSRPLTPLSSDPNDLSVLTPSHFLTGKPLTSLPDPDLTEIKENRLSRFQRIQQLQQHYWTRWSREYISELQGRTKWRINQDILKPGALVIIKEDHTSPLHWSLGRITSTHPGPDGIVRVASVKTSRGLVKRSFSKLCPLPIETEK